MSPSRSSIALLLLAVVGISACGSASRTLDSAAPTAATVAPGTTTPQTTQETTLASTAATTPETTTADTRPFDDPEPDPDADVGALVDRDWTLTGIVTIAGLQQVDGDGSGIRFSDNGDGTGSVAMDDGCNAGSATVIYQATRLDLGPLATTDKACTDDSNIAITLSSTFGYPLGWIVDGDTLSLTPLLVTDSGLEFSDAAGSDPDASTTTAPVDAEATTDRAAVLAAAAVGRITVYNSFGGDDVFTAVTIIDRLGAVGKYGEVDDFANAVLLTDQEKAAIEAALAPRTVVWAPDPKDDALIAQILGGQLAALVTLAEPMIDNDSATITSGVQCGGTCGTGGAFTLERQADGSWMITGQPGPQWIS